ncbi:MAG: hypothetical protein ACFFFK_08210 [Candidatus Thorarchaeota archaeon]
MGVTYRGSATPLTEQRTDQMIVIISIGLVLALAVGGFIVAANSYGDQKQCPSDNNQENIVIDYFDPSETAHPQSVRELSFVWESESGRFGPLCTEQGSIDITASELPDVLPLCIDNDYLANWYVEVLSYGGYEPHDGYIVVWQKDEIKGTIYVQWTFSRDGECCAYDYWIASFYTDDKICLESNQYPDVAPWILGVPDGQQMIPGKEVYFCITTYWTGCIPGGDQDFTIIPAHSYWALSKCVVLTLQPNTLNPHRNLTYPIQCYIETSIVYNIFELKKENNGGVRIGQIQLARFN